MRVRMNTAAVTHSLVMNEGKEYDLPDKLARAFIKAGQAEPVKDAAASPKKRKETTQ